MTVRYFKLRDDEYIPDRWHLSTAFDEHGQEVDPWQFTEGSPVPVEGQLRMSFRRTGAPLDFTLGGLDIPVVREHVASLLSGLAPNDVQFLPVDIEGQTDPFCIFVATRLIQCIDDHATEEVRYWTEEDGQPEKVGTYCYVGGMRIDPSKVGDAKIFRTRGWTVALIVSEDIKVALERAGVTGLYFREV